MNVHCDHRRMFFGDVFPVPEGSLNVVYIPPGAAPYTERHRHQHQTDYFFVVQGQLQFTLRTPSGQESHMRLDGEYGPRALTVPPNVWHHYQAGQLGASYVMWATRKYDGTDEEREPL